MPRPGTAAKPSKAGARLDSRAECMQGSTVSVYGLLEESVGQHGCSMDRIQNRERGGKKQELNQRPDQMGGTFRAGVLIVKALESYEEFQV